MILTSIEPFDLQTAFRYWNKRVLIVEDDDMLRDLVVRQVGSLGYQVSEAPDGPTGLDMIHEHSNIDLLFTDITMPGGMSGYDLAEKAASLRPDLRILFTSGFSKENIGHRSRLGEKTLLRKPYRRKELAHQLRKIFEDDTLAIHGDTGTTKVVCRIGLG